MYEHFSKQTFLLLIDTNITNSDSVLLIQMPVNSSPVQTDFLTFAFALLGELKGTWLKMEFENIKSSAALIYDEFIQNAGQYLELQSESIQNRLWHVL